MQAHEALDRPQGERRRILGGLALEIFRGRCPPGTGEIEQLRGDRARQRTVSHGFARDVGRLLEEREVAPARAREAQERPDERPSARPPLELGERGEQRGVGRVVLERALERRLGRTCVVPAIAVQLGGAGEQVARGHSAQIARRDCVVERASRLVPRADRLGPALEHLEDGDGCDLRGARDVDDGLGGDGPLAELAGDAYGRSADIEVRSAGASRAVCRRGENVQVRRQRAARVVAVGLERRPDLRPQSEDERRVVARRPVDRVAIRLDEPRPRVRRRREPLDLRLDPLVAGRDRERPPHRLEGEARVAGALLRHLGDLEEDGEPSGVARLREQPVGRQLEQPLPVVAGAQRAEEDPDGGRAVRALVREHVEARTRAHVARIDLQGLRVRADRYLVRAELGAVDVAQLAKQLGASARFRRLFDASLEHRGQLGPPGRMSQERREREGCVLGVAEVGLDAAPRFDRLLGSAEHVGQELREAHPIGPPGVDVRRSPRPEAERLREPFAVAHAVEEIDEAVERLCVPLVRLDARLPQRDRARVLPELRRQSRRPSDGLASRPRIALDVRDPLGHVEALFDAAGRLEQRLELARGGQHRLVRDPLADKDRRIERDASRGVSDPVGAQARRLHHERDLERRVLRRGGRGGEEIGEAIEPPRALREIQELRAPRLVLGGVDHGEPRLFEGAREVAELLVEVRDLQVPAHPLLRGAHRLELDEQHAREVRVAAGRRVVVPEPRGGALPHRAARRRRRLRLACPLLARRALAARRQRRPARLGSQGRRREDALEQAPHLRRDLSLRRIRVLEERLDRLERGRSLAQLVEPESRHPRACPARFVGPQRRQPRAQQRDELPVLALALVEAFERAGELRVSGLELLQLLQVADRAIGPVGEVLRGLCGVLEERSPLPAGRGLEGPIVEREEVVPALGRVEDQLQAIERPVGGRIELQYALEDRDDPGRVVEPLLVELHRALADGHRQLARQRP